MSQAIVVTGTDTGVGKTVFAAALAEALGAHYWKPVQAGLDEQTDTERATALAGLPRERTLAEAYRLSTPCSPHRAAEIDGLTIDPSKLTLPTVRPLVVEGAGGALVPLTNEWLFADQMADWRQPTVIVARTALGTINHSLLTIEALRSRGVPLLGIAFVGKANENSESTIARIGRVRRLGRLPWIKRLGRTVLARAFSEQFDTRDFT